MSGGSAPSLVGLHPQRYTHSRISHSDPSYHRSSSSFSNTPSGNHPYSNTSGSYPNASVASTGGDNESTTSSSKRPFPFSSGSQERDKRARSCEGGPSGSNRNTWDGAAWSVRHGEASGSGGNHDDVQSSIGEVQRDDQSSYASATEHTEPRNHTTPAPVGRPFPADSYPMEPRGTSPAPRIPTPAALRSPSPLLSSISSATVPTQRTSPRLAPLRSPSASGLDRLPPLSMHVLTGDENQNQGESQFERPSLDMRWLDEAMPMPRGLEPFTSNRPLRALPGTRRVRSPPPVPNRNSVVGFGSSSVDSALPTGASVLGGRMPLPWVDLEVESGSGSGSSLGMGGSRMVDSMSRMIDSTSRMIDSTVSGSDELEGSLSPIVNGPASPPFGGLASPMASTVQSTNSSTDQDQDQSTNPILSIHTELASSPSTSGSSTSSRTTPSGYTRRPAPTLSLRGFPTSPTFSAASGSPLSESPFPGSASPRTSTFDLAVTPPGSALPSFVARMMEVDSPVREGADHSYTIPELVLEPRAENDAASIDALRRFASRGQPHSYFTESAGEPEIRREPIRFSLGDLTARALRQFEQPESEVFPLPREASEVAQQGSEVGRDSGFTSTNRDSAFTSTNRDSAFTSTNRDSAFSAANRDSTFSATNRDSAFSSTNRDPSNDRDSSTTTGTMHQTTESWASQRPSDLGSAYSQRLTESGVSYPSRPSASETSFPSFRANVSPGPELNMGSRPGRVVRDMSWSFSDVFNRPEAGSEDNEGSRAGVRNALNRAARLPGPGPGPGSLPRLHLNALPRVSNGEDEQSQAWSAMTASNSTNLSRTPPGVALGPTEHDGPMYSEPWIEEGTRPAPPSRRMSSARWTDLFAEEDDEEGAQSQPQPQSVAVQAAPRPMSHRPRPPPIPMSSADNALFDPLSMNWSSDTHQAPYVEDHSQSRQESGQDSLARYQTFAQSIDELRRSPPLHAPPNPWSALNAGTGLRLPPVIAPSTTTAVSTGLDTPRTEATGLSGISTWFDDGSHSRPHWAMPRHEPLPMLDEPRRSSRSPYNQNNDARQPSEPPSQPERDRNWLRDWERERDRRSRVVREDYWQRRETDSTAGSSIEPPHRMHHPMAQLSETQAQGRMWDEPGARHEPPRAWPAMTRSGLATNGFTDDGLPNEWSTPGGSPMDVWRRPPRRQEMLPPPRTNDGDAPGQFTEPSANRISDIPFTESPPSLLQEFIDMGRDSHYYTGNGSFSSDVFQSFQRTNTPRAAPESTTPDFRLASDALRRSMANAPARERNSSSRPGQARSPSSRRFLGTGEQPVQSQPGSSAIQSERPRLSLSRDRWDVQLARSQSQLDRMRQLLQPRSSSGESRERERESRRRLTDIGRTPSSQAQRRRTFTPALDTEPVSPTSLEPSRQWPRESDVQPERPSFLRHDRSSWSSTDNPSRNSLHEFINAASRVRRRRTLLPESTPRRAPPGFLHSMDHAINQVESGLLQLSALAGESSESMRRFSLQTDPVASPTTHEDHSPASRMDWTYDRPERNSPPPRLPPFEFSQLQRNVDWPSSRRNNLERRYEEEDEILGGGSDRAAPLRSLSSYPEHRRNPNELPQRTFRPSYAYDRSWRGDSVGAEAWSNEVTPSSVATSMPMRDRLLFRASAPSRDPPDNAGRGRILRHPDSGSSSTQPTQPLTSFPRLHRRRPSSPNVPPPAPTSPSPPRSYTSRLSSLLPRRRVTSTSDDNDDWAHPGSSSGRMFFLRPRGRGRTTSGGDFLRDEEFDDSYEGLLRLAARIGDAKPRGTPTDVIQAMPSGKYASCPGAKAETRCPICLDDYEQEDMVALIKGCSHWFHKDCINQWLGNSRTCPVCRGQVNGEAGTEPEAGPSSNSARDMW